MLIISNEDITKCWEKKTKAIICIKYISLFVETVNISELETEKFSMELLWQVYRELFKKWKPSIVSYVTEFWEMRPQNLDQITFLKVIYFIETVIRYNNSHTFLY